jgi:uncharacterized sulfatase
MDLGPTVLNLAGVPVPSHMDGQPLLGPDLRLPRRFIFSARDRMDERYDTIRTVRDARYRYIRNFEPFRPYYQWIQYREITPMMVDLRRLHAEGKLGPVADQYFADGKPVEELYDTQTDPHEVHNLASSPEHQDELRRLRRALREWMLESRDLALIPEAEVNELEQQLGNRWAILRQPERQGLPERLLDLVADGEAGKAWKLREALGDPEPPIRYWAAMWLGNHQAVEALGELALLLADDSAIVRVAAARALCLMGRESEGLPVLIDLLTHHNEAVRLGAATELDYLDEAARPALEALREALETDKSVDMQKLTKRAVEELEVTGDG